MNPRILHPFKNEGEIQNRDTSLRFYDCNRHHHCLPNEHYHNHYAEGVPFQQEAWTQRELRSRDGLHFRKGPKGYKKSHERIQEVASEAPTQKESN